MIMLNDEILVHNGQEMIQINIVINGRKFRMLLNGFRRIYAYSGRSHTPASGNFRYVWATISIANRKSRDIWNYVQNTGSYEI